MFNSYQDIFSSRADRYHAAMAACPRAREEEFAAAVELLQVDGGETICDVPSGGGYLAGFIDKPATYLFVETSSYFAAHCPLARGDSVIESSIERLPLDDGSVDRLLSLAALHHVLDKRQALREFARVLAPGGRAVVADVAAGSDTGRFLNEFVDRYNSMGHDGRFLEASFYDAFSGAGLVLDAVEHRELRWNFPSETEMVDFSKQLFGMDLADAGEVRAGIDRYLGSETTPSGVAMRWQLSYAAALKPLPPE